MGKIILSTGNYLKHQKDFFDSKSDKKALVAGFGAGKTFIFLRETLKNHLLRKNEQGVSNGWVIYPTLGLADELFIEPFCLLLDSAKIKYYFNSTKRLFITAYGRVKVFTMETPARMVGSELTYAGIDEFDIVNTERGMAVYNKIIARLRGCENAKLYITTTPEGFRATHRVFVEQDTDEKALFKAKTKNNPYLPKSYIKALEAQYDSKLLSQYMDGEFVNLNGATAYYMFSRDNVADYKRKGGTILVGMDFNVNPMTAVIGEFADGVLNIFDEIYLKNSNTFEMCQEIKNRYPNDSLIVYPDMTGVKRSTSSQLGVTDINILIKEGFKVKGNKNPLVRDRLNMVNAGFESSKILIDKSCKRLINDLEKVITDETGRLDGSNKDLTHISDALGYLTFNLLGNDRPSWKG